MTLAREVLFAGGGLEVRRVVCRPARTEPGAVESAARPTVVVPTAGLFRVHRARHDAFVADAAQAVFLPAGVPHRFSHPLAGGDACLALELDPALLASAAGGQGPAVIARGLLPARSVPLARGLAQGPARGAVSALEAEEVALELVLAAVAALAPRPRSRRSAARRAAGVEAVQVRLAADPGRAFRLGELAAAVATSPCHLVTVFREETGLPIHRYLTRLRLAAALERLAGSERPVGAIALELGFATPSHFAAVFRRAFGLTPRAFRRHARGRAVRELRKIVTAGAGPPP